ncbi:MAG: plastocyanin/azurin family copper-binding protein [Kofleriaceae bacterium]
MGELPVMIVMKKIRFESVRWVIASLLVVVGCIDFGYPVPPLVDAPSLDTAIDGDQTCTEGSVPPSTSGPQLAFATLSVSNTALTIMRGDVVTWTNTDTMPHTVTAGAPGAEVPLAQGGFDSDTISPGAKWAYRFCTPRTVIYFCKTHASQMNGYRVVVSP